MKPVQLYPNDKVPFTHPKFPVMASVKYDGIRAICIAGELYSRTYKQFPNKRISEEFGWVFGYCKQHKIVLEFEFFLENATHHGQHQSVMNSLDAPIPADFSLLVFDCINLDEWEGVRPYRPFHSRYSDALRVHRDLFHSQRLRMIVQDLVLTPEELENSYNRSIRSGYEGLIVRALGASYKHGRITVKEGLGYKFRKFDTVDAVIIEVLPRRTMLEGVDRTITPTGYLEKIHTQDSFTEWPCVGKFVIRTPDGITEAAYGEGFPMEVRVEHWKNKHMLIGQQVEVEHMGHGGKSKLRMPRIIKFKGDADG